MMGNDTNDTMILKPNDTPTMEEILIDPEGSPLPGQPFLEIWVAEDMAELIARRPAYLKAYDKYAKRMAPAAYEHFLGQLKARGIGTEARGLSR